MGNSAQSKVLKKLRSSDDVNFSKGVTMFGQEVAGLGTGRLSADTQAFVMAALELFGVRLREGSVPGQLNTLTAIAAIGRSPAVRSDTVVRDGLRNICIAPVLNLRLVGGSVDIRRSAGTALEVLVEGNALGEWHAFVAGVLSYAAASDELSRYGGEGASSDAVADAAIVAAAEGMALVVGEAADGIAQANSGAAHDPDPPQAPSLNIQIVFPIFLRMVKAEREARAVATLLRATTNLLESPAALSYDAGTSVDAFFRRVLTALHEHGAERVATSARADVGYVALDALDTIVRQFPHIVDVDRAVVCLAHQLSTEAASPHEWHLRVLRSLRGILVQLDSAIESSPMLIKVLLRHLEFLRPELVALRPASPNLPAAVADSYKVATLCLEYIARDPRFSSWRGKYYDRLIDCVAHDIVFVRGDLSGPVLACISHMLEAGRFAFVLDLSLKLFYHLAHFLHPNNIVAALPRSAPSEPGSPSGAPGTNPMAPSSPSFADVSAGDFLPESESAVDFVVANSIPVIRTAFAFLSNYDSYLSIDSGSVGGSAGGGNESDGGDSRDSSPYSTPTSGVGAADQYVTAASSPIEALASVRRLTFTDDAGSGDDDEGLGDGGGGGGGETSTAGRSGGRKKVRVLRRRRRRARTQPSTDVAAAAGETSARDSPAAAEHWQALPDLDALFGSGAGGSGTRSAFEVLVCEHLHFAAGRLTDLLGSFLLNRDERVRETILRIFEGLVSATGQVLVHKIYVHALSRTTARLVSMEMQDKLVQREEMEDELTALRNEVATCREEIRLLSVEASAARASHAAASAQHQLLTDSLMCAICLDTFIGRRPTALPCGHTFCGECLDQLQASSANAGRCPLDRREFHTSVELMGLG